MTHVQDNAEESVREVIAGLEDGNFLYKMDTGQNWAELPDGSRVELNGNDEIDLPAGSIFGLATPGGGGWGAA